jgi:hypothetical protein
VPVVCAAAPVTCILLLLLKCSWNTRCGLLSSPSSLTGTRHTRLLAFTLYQRHLYSDSNDAEGVKPTQYSLYMRSKAGYWPHPVTLNNSRAAAGAVNFSSSSDKVNDKAREREVACMWAALACWRAMLCINVLHLYACFSRSTQACMQQRLYSFAQPVVEGFSVPAPCSCQVCCCGYCCCPVT